MFKCVALERPGARGPDCGAVGADPFRMESLAQRLSRATPAWASTLGVEDQLGAQKNTQGNTSAAGGDGRGQESTSGSRSRTYGCWGWR
ncbi:hypothetical protein SAMD00023353_1601310 [Rosellinia necatrix]|uniref:Uncharacterized protein n=1 Tax=Rosellinia necatrix TaxID=77044 RepID=A0A1S8A782_ROSNE|nr:hypothetical protein SAMD00023353_1601310 [Rosellinia necatrix]